MDDTNRRIIIDYITANPGCDAVDLIHEIELDANTIADTVIDLKEASIIDRTPTIGIRYGYFITN